MHWFKRNIGDYHKKAGRLTMLQHGAYTLLMDACYDREQFPTKEQAIDWVWASTPEEMQAVEFVLSKFFTLEDGIFVQHRIKEEIEGYQSKSETNKRIALEREAKRRNKNTSEHETCTEGKQDENETPPNQEPRTKNQEPIVNTTSTKADQINYQAIQDSFNTKLTKASKVFKMTDRRKRMVKRFFNDFDMNMEKWINYLEYINSSPECDWMFEVRDRGNGQQWQPKGFEFIVSESCYLKVKEQYS